MKRLAALTMMALVAGAAQAHGFGERYDLPIPLSLYLAAAAFTVALSCAMLAYFLRVAPSGGFASAERLPSWLGVESAIARVFLPVLRILVVAIYVLVLVTGFAGNQSPLRNLAPVMVWAVWWVGTAYASALVTDVWALLSPLDTLYGWGQALLERWRPGPRRAPFAMPAGVGMWPAVAFFFAFLAMEMAWEGSDHPASLASAVLVYSMVTWTGMALFGREAWLARSEAFSCVFSLLARFAPIAIELSEGRLVSVRLRPYAVGLLAREPTDASRIALIVLLLAAVTFDGFMETPAWMAIAQAISPGDEAAAAEPLVRLAGLLSAPLLFLAVYGAFCRLVVAASGAPIAVGRIAGLFAFTLVPIAIAYLVAHYLSFLAMAWQYVLALASDPFGWGWNLFGSANRFIRIAVVDARLVWIVSVGAIVTGHVAALYLAHVLALREFPGRRAALRSQYPMLVLMVAYTMTSLWIIAQPIVTSRFG